MPTACPAKTRFHIPTTEQQPLVLFHPRHGGAPSQNHAPPEIIPRPKRPSTKIAVHCLTVSRKNLRRFISKLPYIARTTIIRRKRQATGTPFSAKPRTDQVACASWRSWLDGARWAPASCAGTLPPAGAANGVQIFSRSIDVRLPLNFPIDNAPSRPEHV